MKMKKILNFIVLALTVVLVFQCDSEDANSKYVAPENPDISNEIDTYLYNNNDQSLFELYGTATRWRWSDNFIDPDERATPIKSELVIPMTQLVEYLWIGPFTSVGEEGKAFIDKLFPPELVLLGSRIYELDGSAKLGYAEGGARVTILDANSLDYQSRSWLTNSNSGMLRTLHHEFTHIVDGVYGIPVGFNTISESYVGVDWLNISLNDAIKLGMMSPYGASSETEDFAEIISNFLVMDPETFQDTFITQQDCSEADTAAATLACNELNEGRVLIRQKVDLVVEYYQNEFGIDLYEVRTELQARLELLIETGEIPE